MLEWSDPERAAQMIDAVPLPPGSEGEIEMLEIRGMIYSDSSTRTRTCMRWNAGSRP